VRERRWVEEEEVRGLGLIEVRRPRSNWYGVGPSSTEVGLYLEVLAAWRAVPSRETVSVEIMVVAGMVASEDKGVEVKYGGEGEW